jgi:hypothetical protein
MLPVVALSVIATLAAIGGLAATGLALIPAIGLGVAGLVAAPALGALSLGTGLAAAVIALRTPAA